MWLHQIVLAFGCALLLGSCEQRPRAADLLLYVGEGTSPGDVRAIEDILEQRHFSFSTADTGQLNAMPQATLRAYRLLIVPGGNFEVMGRRLSSSAVANVRNAVHGGLNYLGICGGAFFAGASPYNGLNLTNGIRFHFYAAEAAGTRKSAVAISFPQRPSQDLYWEDGPELSGWGDVAGRYPDGTPAIVEGFAGEGWVILTGIHAEAPARWRHSMRFSTSAPVDHAFAAELIGAALNRRVLAHY